MPTTLEATALLLDWSAPAVQGRALDFLDMILGHIEHAGDAARPDDDGAQPDPAAFRSAMAAAAVLCSQAAVWAGAAG